MHGIVHVRVCGGECRIRWKVGHAVVFVWSTRSIILTPRAAVCLLLHTHTYIHTQIHIHTQTSLPFALIYHLPGLKTRGKSETQRSVSLVWKICTSQSLKHFVLVYVWEMTKWTLRKWSQKVWEISSDCLGTSVLRRQWAQTTVCFVFGYLALQLNTAFLYD